MVSADLEDGWGSPEHNTNTPPALENSNLNLHRKMTKNRSRTPPGNIRKHMQNIALKFSDRRIQYYTK